MAILLKVVIVACAIALVILACVLPLAWPIAIGYMVAVWRILE